MAFCRKLSCSHLMTVEVRRRGEFVIHHEGRGPLCWAAAVRMVCVETCCCVAGTGSWSRPSLAEVATSWSQSSFSAEEELGAERSPQKLLATSRCRGGVFCHVWPALSAILPQESRSWAAYTLPSRLQVVALAEEHGCRAHTWVRWLQGLSNTAKVHLNGRRAPQLPSLLKGSLVSGLDAVVAAECSLVNANSECDSVPDGSAVENSWILHRICTQSAGKWIRNLSG